jgi:predicted ATP-grasp superfamily ATP-dependent carboligase
MKVLLLDTSFASLPIYDFLVRGGHDVWVMGNRPSDLLARKAGANWIEQDYSQVDAVESHIAHLDIERVVPGCTDVSIECCSQLSVAADLRDGAEVNKLLGDKQSFRAVCEHLELPAPRVVAESAFPLPGTFIVKPVDSFSGRGISIFDGNDLGGLRRGIDVARRASPSSRVLIEHFIRGELYSCSAFVEGHRLNDVFFVREGSSVNPFAVDTSYLAWDVPSEAVGVLRDGLERLCAFLQLKDGLLHTQFILSENRPLIVEVSRRCPGDLYPLLIEYTTGFRYAAKYASCFLGERLPERPRQRRHVLRHTVTADVDSVFEGLVLTQSQRIRGFFPIAAMGERLHARQLNRAGILFCECSSYQELTNTYRQFLERRSYRVATLSPVTEAAASEQAAGESGRHLAVGAAGA